MKKPLSPAKRARINRNNAQKSTGPRSEAGKKSASMNSCKHGLCAKSLALPVEDATLLQEKLAWWNEHYEPATPGECELIEMAVSASVQRDRSRRYLTAALSEQVLVAEKRWDEAREDEVLALVKLLDKEPGAAVARLRRTGHGCRWLIARWRGLDERLATPESEGGGWGPADCLEAIRLQGQFADPTHLDGSPEASATRHHFEALFPDAVLGGYAGGPVDIRDILRSPGWGKPKNAGPDPEEVARQAEARRWLSGTIARHLHELEAWEAIVREAFDAPSRALAKERALLLEGPAGSNWQRYERMHELAFHRAYAAFLKGREGAEEDEEEGGEEPVLPNEANEGHRGPLMAEGIGVYATPPGPKNGAPETAGGEVGATTKLLAGAVAPTEEKRKGSPNG